MYEKKWNSLRRIIRNLIIVGALGGILVIASNLYLSHSTTIIVFLIAWLAGLYYAWKFSNWICPRCNDYYFMKGYWINPHRKKCINCGLRKWSSEEY